MARARLIHGFNVTDSGKSTVGMLEPELYERGIAPVRFRYGWLFILGVLFYTRSIARRLARETEPGEILIGHSNGCYVAHRAIKQFGAPAKGCIFIAPALDCDADLEKRIKHVDVYHDPDDCIVALAGYVPPLKWGRMGQIGHCLENPRYRNHRRHGKGHSKYFNDPVMRKTIADHALMISRF